MTWPEPAAVDPALPLAGIRVLDLSRVVAGPYAAMVLGDLGADVVKVEHPDGGDETRRWGPPFRGSDAAYFFAMNRNRRSLALDLATPAGLAVVRELATAADIVVENFLAPQLARLGLDEVRDACRQTIWVSIRGAGSDGPLADLPGYDAMAQAASGLMAVTGEPDGRPTKVGVPIVDILTGLHAAVAVLAALHGRDSAGGRAARVEVPLLECAVSALLNQAASFLVGGVAPRRLGNDHPNLAPYGPIATADAALVVGAVSNRQFAALCAAIGVPALADDERFATNALRVAHRVELLDALREVFATAPTEEWERRLTAVGVPCAPVRTVEEAVRQPHVRAAGLVQQVGDGAGAMELVGSPVTFDGRRPPVRLPPPALGEHTDEILRQVAEEMRDF